MSTRGAGGGLAASHHGLQGRGSWLNPAGTGLQPTWSAPEGHGAGGRRRTLSVQRPYPALSTDLYLTGSKSDKNATAGHKTKNSLWRKAGTQQQWTQTQLQGRKNHVVWQPVQQREVRCARTGDKSCATASRELRASGRDVLPATRAKLCSSSGSTQMGTSLMRTSPHPLVRGCVGGSSPSR